MTQEIMHNALGADLPVLLSAKTFADRLGVDRSTITRMIAAGRVHPAVAIEQGSHTVPLFTEAELARAIADRDGGAA